MGLGLRQKRPAAFWTVAALVAAAVAYGAFVVGNRIDSVDRPPALPTLPDLSQQPSALRLHLTEADRAARAQPTSPDAVAALGLAYHADMFYDEAQRCYAIAETLSGAWRWTYLRALAQSERGDAGGLADALRRVTRAAPEFSPAWWRLGETELKAGRYDAAETAWRRASSLPNPEPPPGAQTGSPHRTPVAPIAAYATFGLARIAIIKGDPDDARANLESITANAPRFGPAFRLLAEAYTALGRADDAARVTRIADRSPGYDPYVDPTIDELVRESRNPTFLLQQAAATDASTNAPWRELLIRRALDLDPEHTDALFELASLLRALRRYGEALELLERHRRLVPDDFQVLADIGRCLSGLRRFAEAETMLRRALEGLDDANTRYDLGLVLDREGRVKEAIAEYQRAIERNPNHRDALNNLGVAFARQGQLPRAVRQFERLVAVDPDNADAHTNLGVMLLSQGARDLAAREFRVALQLSPDHALAREGLQKLER